MLKNPPTPVKRGMDNRDAAASELTVKHIYQKSVAASIAKNVKVIPQENKFRRPKDTMAQRVANEFVCNFLRRHGCDYTLDLAFRESKEFIQELHDIFWLGRKLDVFTDKPLFGQLIDAMGRDPNYRTPSQTQDEDQQHIRMRVKKTRNIPDDLLQSSDPNALTRLTASEKEKKLSIPPFDIENINNRDNRDRKKKEKKREHGKHYHRHHKSEEITFTVLEPDEPKDRFMVPLNGRYSDSRKPVLEKADKSVFVQKMETDTYIDTYVTPTPITTKIYSEKTERQSEIPQPKGSFAERVARLLVPHRYKNLETQLDKNKDFPTLHTQDFEVLGVQVTEDMSTNTDIDGVSNLLQNYLKNMEGPDRQQMRPIRDYTYRVPDREPTTNVTDTNTNFTTNTPYTTEMSSTSGLSTEQTSNTNNESDDTERPYTCIEFIRRKLQCPERQFLNTYEDYEGKNQGKRHKRHRTIRTREKTDNGSYEYDYVEASYYVEESMYETVNSSNAMEQSPDKTDLPDITPSSDLPVNNRDEKNSLESAASKQAKSKTSSNSAKKEKKGQLR